VDYKDNDKEEQKKKKKKKKKKTKKKMKKKNKKKLPVEQIFEPVTYYSAYLRTQTAFISAATSTEGNTNSRTAGGI